MMLFKKKKPICWVALCPLFQISVTDPSMLEQGGLEMHP